MIYVFGHERDLDEVNIENEAIRAYIKDHLTILDDEYGCDRNVDEDDGGYILYCEHGTTCSELSCVFEYEEAVCEYTERIAGTDFCSATYICNNEYVVVIVIALADAPAELTDYIIGG